VTLKGTGVTQAVAVSNEAGAVITMATAHESVVVATNVSSPDLRVDVGVSTIAVTVTASGATATYTVAVTRSASASSATALLDVSLWGYWGELLPKRAGGGVGCAAAHRSHCKEWLSIKLSCFYARPLRLLVVGSLFPMRAASPWTDVTAQSILPLQVRGRGVRVRSLRPHTGHSAGHAPLLQRDRRVYVRRFGRGVGQRGGVCPGERVSVRGADVRHTTRVR
jgi:hypothetical protein